MSFEYSYIFIADLRFAQVFLYNSLGNHAWRYLFLTILSPWLVLRIEDVGGSSLYTWLYLAVASAALFFSLLEVYEWVSGSGGFIF